MILLAFTSVRWLSTSVAVGDRIRLFEGALLRLEGRAIFAPRTDPRFGGRWLGHLVGSVGMTMFAPVRHRPS